MIEDFFRKLTTYFLAALAAVASVVMFTVILSPTLGT